MFEPGWGTNAVNVTVGTMTAASARIRLREGMGATVNSVVSVGAITLSQ
jgi:hypothetical protein